MFAESGNFASRWGAAGADQGQVHFVRLGPRQRTTGIGAALFLSNADSFHKPADLMNGVAVVNAVGGGWVREDVYGLPGIAQVDGQVVNIRRKAGP